MKGRILILIAVALTAGLSAMLAPRPAHADILGTATQGLPGQTPWLFPSRGPGLELLEDAGDPYLQLTITPDMAGTTTEAKSGALSGFVVNGVPGVKAGFERIRLHVTGDVREAGGVTPSVFFTADLGPHPAWLATTLLGDEDGEWVYDLPAYAGGKAMRYKIQFKLGSGSTTGTVRVEDMALDYGTYVPAPESKGTGGGGKGGTGSTPAGDTTTEGSGFYYMGGAAAGAGTGGAGTGGTGAGSAGTGVAGTGSAGSAGSAGTGGSPDPAGLAEQSTSRRLGKAVVIAPAPLDTSAATTTAASVLGYPMLQLQPEPASAGSGGAAGASAIAGEAASSGGGGAQDLSWLELAWLAPLLALFVPLLVADRVARRLQRRLHTLIETGEGLTARP